LRDFLTNDTVFDSLIDLLLVYRIIDLLLVYRIIDLLLVYRMSID